jgi:hypothetical protein
METMNPQVCDPILIGILAAAFFFIFLVLPSITIGKHK